MTRPAQYDIDVVHGDDWGFDAEGEFQLLSGGVPVNLTGSTITAQVGGAWGSQSFTVTILDATQGKFRLFMSDTQTASIPVGKAQIYDVQVVDSAGNKRTWFGGRFNVWSEVTIP